jgi:hypothetical protein
MRPGGVSGSASLYRFGARERAGRRPAERRHLAWRALPLAQSAGMWQSPAQRQRISAPCPQEDGALGQPRNRYHGICEVAVQDSAAICPRELSPMGHNAVFLFCFVGMRSPVSS